MGVGHLMRCIALAEELLGRGVEVVFLGEFDGVGWAGEELAVRGIARVPGPVTPDALVQAAGRLSLDAVVIDSYELPPDCAQALRDAGFPVLCVVDVETRGQRADLYLDQNLGAEELYPPEPAYLAGGSYALLRDGVRRLRPAQPPTVDRVVPEVVCFFGGTDAANAVPTLTGLLVATGAPFNATVVAPRPFEPPPLAPGQSVTAIAPHPELPARMATADLVVGAAGTSTWEMLCLGVPAAVAWVVDNQERGHAIVAERGLAAGLGKLAELKADGPTAKTAIETLRMLLTEPARRQELARRAHAVIDGKGRERVADALLSVV